MDYGLLQVSQIAKIETVHEDGQYNTPYLSMENIEVRIEYDDIFLYFS